jgi:hypothetical protein
VPNTREGIINIPIGLGKLEDRYRPTLRPDYDSSKGRGYDISCLSSTYINPKLASSVFFQTRVQIFFDKP